MKSRSILLFSLIALAWSASFVQAEDPEQPLPSAREVFDRFVEVTNAEKIENHDSRKVVGTFSIPSQGLNGNMVVWQKAPNLRYSEVELPGVGKVREGFDGTEAWEMNPMVGPRVFEGDVLQQKMNESNYYLGLYRPEDIEAAEVVGRSTFDGEEAWEVDLTRAGGQRSKEYFSIESGLMLGGTMEVVDPMGTFPARTQMGRYEELDGVVVATQVTTTVMGQQFIMLIDEVSHEEIEESVFELPAEIEAMVSQD